MLSDFISQLEALNEVYALKEPLQPENSKKLLNVIRGFLQSAENRFDNIQPRDQHSVELKATYLTEKEAWSYLLDIFQSESDYFKFYEPKKREKNEFFQFFNQRFAELFHQKNLFGLEGLGDDRSYLSTDYITDLSLINDIIQYDPILSTLHSLTQCFPDTEAFPPEPALMGMVDDFKDVAKRAEWDFLGSADPKSSSEMSKFDSKLNEHVYRLLRNGKVVDAQKYLIHKSRFVYAANLNSGLAFHDFSRMDREVDEAVTGIVEEELEREDFFRMDFGRRRENKAKDFQLKALDFMRCLDFEEAYQERKCFYTEKDVKLEEGAYYQGSCGNRNWLFSLSNFFTLSQTSPNKFERAVYGYMSSNPLVLLPLANDFKTILWVYLRCFLNQEVIKRFVSLIYIFKQNLLTFCMFDEEFLDFEKKDLIQIYESIIQNPEEIRNLFANLGNVMQEISRQEDWLKLSYNRIQFLLIKAHLESLSQRSPGQWRAVFEELFLLSTCPELPKVEFATFFSLVIRALWKLDLDDFEIDSISKIDQILLNFLKLPRKSPLSPEETIMVCNYMSDENLKIEFMSQYLLTLKSNHAETKRTMVSLMPKVTPGILDNLTKSSKVGIDLLESIEEKDFPDAKRIKGLDWFWADGLNLEKAIFNTLKLIRVFLIEGKKPLAQMILKEYLKAKLPKDDREIENLMRAKGFSQEYEAYGLFFEAEQETLERIRRILVRSSLETEKYSIIDLKSEIFRGALSCDEERGKELFEVKGVLLSDSIDFMLRVYESQSPTNEIQEVLNILTAEWSKCHQFLTEEKFREFLRRVSNGMLKSREFIGFWLDNTEIKGFDEWLFN